MTWDVAVSDLAFLQFVALVAFVSAFVLALSWLDDDL